MKNDFGPVIHLHVSNIRVGFRVYFRTQLKRDSHGLPLEVVRPYWTTFSVPLGVGVGSSLLLLAIFSVLIGSRRELAVARMSVTTAGVDEAVSPWSIATTSVYANKCHKCQ